MSTVALWAFTEAERRALAPKKPFQKRAIKVTRAMVNAGKDLMLDYDPKYTDDAEFVRRLYRAMESAKK